MLLAMSYAIYSPLVPLLPTAVYFLFLDGAPETYTSQHREIPTNIN